MICTNKIDLSENVEYDYIASNFPTIQQSEYFHHLRSVSRTILYTFFTQLDESNKQYDVFGSGSNIDQFLQPPIVVRDNKIFLQSRNVLITLPRCKMIISHTYQKSFRSFPIERSQTSGHFKQHLLRVRNDFMVNRFSF